MRLRGYHLRGSNDVEDFNFDFKGEDHSPLNVVYIFGKNGSGKSYILGSIARSWSGSILSGSSTDLSYIADMLRIDYELGTDICSVHIRRGSLETSSTLAKFADIDVGENPHIKNGVIYYSSNRLVITRSTVRGGSNFPGSTCSVFPIIYDLHMRGIRDSVILIDDWDQSLDKESRKSFYTHLTRHAFSKGNQVILTSSNVPASWVPSQSVFSLRSRTDPTQASMKLLNSVEYFTREDMDFH